MRKAVPLAFLVAVAYVLGVLSVALFGTDSAIEEFEIGQTTFVLRGWSSEEGKELKELYENAYPILEEIYETEPTNVHGQEGVEVIIKKEASLRNLTGENALGIITYVLRTNTWVMSLLSSENRGIAVHELAHAFWGPIKPTNDLYTEGFVSASEFVVGEWLGENFQDQDIQFYLGGLDPSLGNKKQLVIQDDNGSRLGVLEGARQVLAGQVWLDVLERDPRFIAKFRARIIGGVLTGTRNFNFIELIEDLFEGDWEAVKASHNLLQDPPSGDQIAIVPTTSFEEPKVGQLVAVAFVAGKEETALVDMPTTISSWIDGEKKPLCNVRTSSWKGGVLICTVEELLKFRGHTLRFRATTGFGSDEVTLEVTEEGEIRAAKGVQH